MFPVSGSFHGPGGNFKLDFLVLESVNAVEVKMKMVIGSGNRKLGAPLE